MKKFIWNVFQTLSPRSWGGYGLLQKFYKEYLDRVPELFLVLINDNNKICGFCMGYYCDYNNYQKNFLKHNFFLIALRMLGLLFSGNKCAWKKCRTLLKKKNETEIISDKYNQYNVNDKGDLLSICVLPEYRGTGAAAQLISKYEQILLKKAKKICLLSVETKNDRAIKFYEKMDYEPYRRNGEASILYAKKL